MLNCSDILTAWEPLREAAGLSPAVMSMWCSVSVQPVIDAYNGAFGNPDMSVSGRKSVVETSSICRLTVNGSYPSILSIAFKILICRQIFTLDQVTRSQKTRESICSSESAETHCL